MYATTAEWLGRRSTLSAPLVGDSFCLSILAATKPTPSSYLKDDSKDCSLVFSAIQSVISNLHRVFLNIDVALVWPKCLSTSRQLYRP
jgi:hypothetical protein